MKLLVVTGRESFTCPQLGIVVQPDVSNSAIDDECIIADIKSNLENVDITVLTTNVHVSHEKCRTLIASDLNDLIARFNYLTDPMKSDVEYDAVLVLFHALPSRPHNVTSVRRRSGSHDVVCEADRSIQYTFNDQCDAALTFVHRKLVKGAWINAIHAVKTRTSSAVINVMTTNADSVKNASEDVHVAASSALGGDVDITLVVPIGSVKQRVANTELQLIVVGKRSAVAVEKSRVASNITAAISELIAQKSQC